MSFRYLICVCLLFSALGCGAGDSKPIINTADLTEQEKAAIKAADEAVNSEESAGKPGPAGS
jgi:hypothetical protein